MISFRSPAASAVLTRLALASTLVLSCSGCAHTAREAARQAAPAAVEGAVDGAEDPETRGDVATILSDPRILEASSKLAEAVTEGVMDGVTRETDSPRFEELNRRLVTSFGAAFAESLRTEIGPALSASLARATDETLERALDARVEERLEALTRTAVRGGLLGLGDALADESGTLSSAVSRVARDAGREAALGLNDAVQQRVQHADEAPKRDGQLLAAVGKTADATASGLPFLLWGVGALLVVGLFLMALFTLHVHKQLDRLTRELESSRAGWSSETPRISGHS